MKVSKLGIAFHPIRGSRILKLKIDQVLRKRLVIPFNFHEFVKIFYRLEDTENYPDLKIYTNNNQ